MKRRKLSKRINKKSFKKATGVHNLNRRPLVRGGFRL